MSVIVQCATRNRLLEALPGGEQDRLRPFLREVTFHRGQIVAEAGQRFERVYFPHRMVVAMVSVMVDGTVVDTATIGREGAFGFGLLGRGGSAMARHVVQIAGTAAVLPHGQLRRLGEGTDQVPNLRALLAAAGEALVAQVLQSVACNAAHTIEQRVCRMLLMILDRSNEETLPITQEVLAEMLHVRRASVSAVAASLQERRLIRYRRGMVTITDRHGLETLSCECYDSVRHVCASLLPSSFGS